MSSQQQADIWRRLLLRADIVGGKFQSQELNPETDEVMTFFASIKSVKTINGSLHIFTTDAKGFYQNSETYPYPTEFEFSISLSCQISFDGHRFTIEFPSTGYFYLTPVSLVSQYVN